MRGKLYIGTSGWNYNHWRGKFYPIKLSGDKWLAYYTHNFSTVEINNTFYQLPEKSTLNSWRKDVPANFVFSVKASRYITHMKKLKDAQESVKKFLQRIKILDKQLGPVLFQLPPKWHANPDRLYSFLKILPRKYRYVFEFRDESWWNEQVISLLKDYNTAFCIFDLAGNLSPQEICADFTYVRLHGPDKAYQGSYDNKKLGKWKKSILSWQKQGLDVYCYFDNDQNAYAIKDAKRLSEIMAILN